MGADIHCNIEVRENGTWHRYSPMVKNQWYSPDRELSVWNEPEVPDKGYDNRDYNLFAILAGVRNRDEFEPISAPRGLPNDVDEMIKVECSHWGSDAHSASYLSLQEILIFNWDKVVQRHGYIPERLYDKWDKKSCPSSYNRGDCGEHIVEITEAEYLDLKALGKLDSDSTYYLLITWVQTYRDCLDKDWWVSIDRLKQYAEKYGGPENVRLTFWFDN